MYGAKGFPVQDMRWLQQRRRGWYAVLEIAPSLRAALGKRRFVRSLKTRDHAVALARRHAALAEFNAEIERARKPAEATEIMAAAMTWRETFKKIEAGDLSGFTTTRRPGPEWPEQQVALNIAVDGLEQSIGEIAHYHSPALAKAFEEIATGRGTPVALHIEDWLAEPGKKGVREARTIRQCRSVLREFEAWAKANSVPPLLESATRQVAGKFVTGMVVRAVHPVTINSKLAAIRSYWSWLVRRGVTEANPWSGQGIAKTERRDADDAGKRPFTAEEVTRLLTGPADRELMDAMLIAVLSGMRVSEIGRLTVGTCQDSTFTIRKGKSKSALRLVPIHSSLAPIVARLVEGKQPNDSLLTLSAIEISKRFIRYRRAIGVDDTSPGARQSAIDFHSWRRWFTTECERAGIPENVVDAVTGHAGRVGMSYGLYSGGPSLEQRRTCVESVHLPTGVPTTCTTQPTS